MRQVQEKEGNARVLSVLRHLLPDRLLQQTVPAGSLQSSLPGLRANYCSTALRVDWVLWMGGRRHRVN